MTTLTTKDGTEWLCLNHNGRFALGHKGFAIHFDGGFYHIKERGKILFTGFNVVECLEVSREVMLDYYASQFVPSWEQP